MSIRKDGEKYLVVVEVGSGGERRRRTKRFSRLTEAKRWESEMNRRNEELDMEGYDITFATLAAGWLEHKREVGVAESTFRKYENGIRVSKQFPFYTKKAREIKKPELEEALNSLAETYTKRYIVDIKASISAVFSFGIDKDYIVKNPCQKAALPKPKKKGRKADSFTKDEVRIMESYKDRLDFGDVIFVMLNTGLRGQEVCCLNKDSIIIKEGQPYLIVNKAMTRNGGHWVVGTPKTESSERTIPISKETYQTILQRVMRSPQNHFIDGETDGYISYTHFRKKVAKFISELQERGEDIRYLPPHCFRHTFASRCEWSGIKSSVAKELLGHATEDMTHYYTHIMNTEKLEAIANLK